MSEALRLAAILEDEKMHSMTIDIEAAAELRRLHDALSWIAEHDLRGTDLMLAGHMAHGFIGRARAALTKDHGIGN